MNYQAFTNESLTVMYESIRGALAADEALKRQDMETRFRVRETPEWREHRCRPRVRNAEAGHDLRGYRLVGRSGDVAVRITTRISLIEASINGTSFQGGFA